MSDFEKGYAQGFLAAKQELAEVTRERDELKVLTDPEICRVCLSDHEAEKDTIRQQTVKEILAIISNETIGHNIQQAHNDIVAAIRKRFEVRG